MKTNKILLGSLLGGFVYFLLGYVVYGLLLSGYMTANINNCAALPMDQMNLPYMFISNVMVGLLLSRILVWSETKTMKDAAIRCGIVGFLVAASIDLSFLAISTMLSNFQVLVVDSATWFILNAAAGAAAFWVINLKKETNSN